MRTRRSAAVNQEASSPATGGTPWKGRLRSHHATPQSLPLRRLPLRSKDQEWGEEIQSSQKPAPPKNTGRGHNTGAARQPKVLLRRSMRLAGRDAEHPIVIDGTNDEYEVGPDRSAVMPLRRSPRFHPEDKALGKTLAPNRLETPGNTKTQIALSKGKAQENLKPLLRKKNQNEFPQFHPEDKALGKTLTPSRQETPGNTKTQNAPSKDKTQKNLKPLARKKNQNESQPLCKDPQVIPPRKMTADVSNKKGGRQERKPSHCEVLTGKRKRGMERSSSSKRQSYHEPKSLSAYCQNPASSNKPRESIHRMIKKDSSIKVKPKLGHERLANIDENIDMPGQSEREGTEICCGSDYWTKEQDMALRQAYFTARPSPHFWKRVSKMVPGRSAEDCFNRIHADVSTPTPIGPRPRTSKTTFSPIGNFTLSDPKLPNILEPTVGRQRTTKQKSLAAQKTVRHLLQKQCLIDQAQEADHFSIFETSPSALKLNFSFEDSPGTPESYMNSGSVGKCRGSSSAQKKPCSRLRTKPSEPSPAVLKPVKNVILHEKYIDQLSRRVGTKGHRKRTSGSKAANSGNTLSEQQAGGLKAAKNALISEATDFISTFKKLQANSLAHIVENNEDDETEYETSDYCHDDKD